MDIHHSIIQKTLPSTLYKGRQLKTEVTTSNKAHLTAHNDTPQQFLELFIADIYHKTQPEFPPVRSYFFRGHYKPKDTPIICCIKKLGIVKFQIPNEVPSTALDTICTRKHIAFRTPLHTYRLIKPRNNRQQPLKPAIMIHAFQDHLLQKQSSQDHSSHIVTLLQDHSSQKTIISGPSTAKCPYFTRPFYHSLCS